jgi:hypothetical protein
LKVGIDQILNQLDLLIASEPSERKYSHLVLGRLLEIVGGEGIWRIYPLSNREWLVLNRDLSPISQPQGEAGEDHHQLSLADMLVEKIGDTPKSTAIEWSQQGRNWIAVSLQEQSWRGGGLLLDLGAKPVGNSTEHAEPLMRACGELLQSHAMRWRSQRWLDQTEELQKLNDGIRAAGSCNELDFILANDLRVFLKADQVSVWRRKATGGVTLSQVSDATAKVSKDRLPAASEQLVEKAFQSSKIGFENLPSMEGKPEYRMLAIPWKSEKDDMNCSIVLLVNWSDENLFNDSLQRLRSSLPLVETAFAQTDRLLRVPTWLRLPFRSRHRWSAFLLRAAMCLIPVAILSWIALQPMAFVIDGKGVLEPVEQANIFASADGFVQSLAITDGAKVEVQQELIRLRSPELQLALEDLQGELLALQEKRNGFQISLNQLVDGDTKSQVARSQVSAEIVELDLREKQLLQLIKLKESEIEDLKLLSPLKGLVVTENIKELLDNRPVRRGESLLKLVNDSGQWHVKVEISDFDAGHVFKYYNAQESAEARFRLASDPEKEVVGRIVKISESVHRSSEAAPVWTAYVDIDEKEIADLRFGSTAAVKFDCGKRPVWYVWLRPLIETLKRRFWI